MVGGRHIHCLIIFATLQDHPMDKDICCDMQTLVVFDNQYNYYDMVRLHQQGLAPVTNQSSRSELKDSQHAKTCDSVVIHGRILPLKDCDTCQDFNYGQEAGQTTEKRWSEIEDVVELCVRNLSQESKKSCCTERWNICDKNNLPKPYSILKISKPRYHFETVQVLETIAPSGIHATSFLVLSVDSYLASVITYFLTKNDTFQLGFSNFVTAILKGARAQTNMKNRGKPDRIVAVVLHEPKSHVINYPWCNRLLVLVTKRMMLEEMMAWLSTLGGGYSSLGDFYINFAEEAGRISIQQFKIALELGDPIVQCKCRLFFALSLMQKGQLMKSKQLLRNEFLIIKQGNFKDERLKNMAMALWIKLKNTYKERKILLNGVISAQSNSIKVTVGHTGQF